MFDFLLEKNQRNWYNVLNGNISWDFRSLDAEGLVKNMSKNIINYIKKSNISRLLCLLNSDDFYITEKNSDFELFDIFEKALPLFAGHSERKNYEALLKNNGLDTPKYGMYSRQESCRRWRTVNGLSPVEYESGASMHYNNIPVDSNFVEIDINEVLFNNTTKKCSFTDVSANIIERVKSTKRKKIIVNIDLSDTLPSRPDPYSASEAYKNIGVEKCNNKERYIIVTQLLINLIIGLRENGKIIVVFKGDPNGSIFILKYLADSKLFSGSSIIDISPCTDTNEIADVAHLCYPNIKIYPRLDISEEVINTSLFENYPIGAFLIRGEDKTKTFCKYIDSISDSEEHSDMLLTRLKRRPEDI